MTDVEDNKNISKLCLENENSSLELLRKKIDTIDSSLLEIYNERANVVQEIAKVKKKQAGNHTPKFYCPERESYILKRAIQSNKGPLDSNTVERFFREIMLSCLSLQDSLKISFLGPEGTFTHQATLNYFGDKATFNSCQSIEHIFEDVAKGVSHYGIVPIENSIGGYVSETLDSFFLYPAKIFTEIIQRIHLNLLVIKGKKNNTINLIYAHSQAITQCRQWLQKNYPNAELISLNSNGEAAKRIIENQEDDAAAIAGELATSLYDLEVIEAKIEDKNNNFTRFLILSNQCKPPSGNDKTTAVITVSNKPGSLCKILESFAKNRINLSRLESRCIKEGLWKYAFFIDVDGHIEDKLIKKSFDEINQYVLDIHFLGSYPTINF